MEVPEIERLIVETHATVATLIERSVSVDNKLAGIITRVDKTNGSVAAIQAEQYKQEGAAAMFKWMFAAVLVVMSVGVAVAGFVLAVVTKTGGG